MLKVRNAVSFMAGLDEAMLAMEKEAKEVFRGFCVNVFFDVLKRTPQWSGNAVANWNFSVGSEDTSTELDMKLALDTSKRKYGEPLYRKGDLPGINRAKSRNSGKDRQVILGSSVYLTNAAQDLGKSYIMMLEDNPNNFLREENTPGHMVEHAVDKFSIMDITTDAGRLKKLRLV